MDGTRIFKGSGQNTENLMYTFSSGLAPRLSAFLTKYWVAQIPKHQICDGTIAAFASMWRWQFRTLKTGKAPRFGYYREVLKGRMEPGSPYAGGMIALFAAIKSDAAEKRAQHGYDSSYHYGSSG